jgi:putative ABC transport system substrate-binding protein
MDGCFCGAPARTRLDRGPHHRGRVPLVGGPHRALHRDRGRVRSAQRRCHCHGKSRRSSGKAGDIVIPIVFVLALDPVGGGLVASPAQPGGNVTGLSIQAADLAGKRLELLREVVPRLRGLAIMGDVDFAEAVLEMGEVQAAARTLGLEVAPLEIRRAEDITPAFEALKAQADALYVAQDALVAANRTRILTLALGARLPTIFGTRDFVQAGALMSYGPNFPDQFRRAAELVDKILHGTKPADIPVEQPTKFDLVINLTTAKALSLEVPPQLLARAHEVIE